MLIKCKIFRVSSIESKSSHPMAAALVDYARSKSIEPKPDDVMEFQNFHGEGIYGNIDGKEIYIGNPKIGLRAGCTEGNESSIITSNMRSFDCLLIEHSNILFSVPRMEGDAKQGKSIGYIYSGGIPTGIFGLSDSCRTGAAEAITELKSMGIKTAMITGDNLESAMYAQDQVHLYVVRSLENFTVS